MRRLLVPGCLLLAAYYAAFGGEYSHADVVRARGAVEVTAAELAVLEAEARHLEQRVEALEHDPRVLERLAREHFGMIRDGEILVRFAGGSGPSSGQEGDEVDTAPRGR